MMRFLICVVLLSIGCGNSKQEWKDKGWVVDLFESNGYSDVFYHEEGNFSVDCSMNILYGESIEVEYTNGNLRISDGYCCNRKIKGCVGIGGVILRFKMADKYKCNTIQDDYLSISMERWRNKDEF